MAQRYFTLGRRRLTPTPVFDTFWRFAAARQHIYEARLAGLPGPWTDDPVLRAFRFTNVFRASDRVSQFLIREVIYDQSRADEDVVFRVLLFKFFNRISTWRALEDLLGPVDWGSYDPQRYADALDELSRRGPIYSPAYVIPPPRLGGLRKHHNHLSLLQLMMDDCITDRLRGADGLREVYEDLASYPSIGRFLAFQFTIDLNYSPLNEVDENDFVVAGPGAIDGIRKCFGPEVAGAEEDVIHAVVARQQDEFDRLGLAFGGLFGRPLHLIDAQNLFCEVDKYARVVHPHVQGQSGRSRIKQRFRATDTPVTARFPPSWNLRCESQSSRVEINRHEALTLFP